MAPTLRAETHRPTARTLRIVIDILSFSIGHEDTKTCLQHNISHESATARERSSCLRAIVAETWSPTNPESLILDPSQKSTLKPTRMIRGARISDGARYVEPTALFRLTTCAAFPMLKKSTVGEIRRVPNLNARERRRSTLVTVGNRSSPRLLRNAVWVARVSVTPCAAASARETENVDTYG